jgi:hypothetical protein
MHSLIKAALFAPLTSTVTYRSESAVTTIMILSDAVEVDV